MSVGALMQYLSGLPFNAILSATAELDLAEVLAGGPLEVSEVASRCGAQADAIGRLLRALAVLGLVARTDDERYASTPALAFLRTGGDGSLRALALLHAQPPIQAAWQRFADAIRTGTTGFQLAHGRPFFDHLDAHDGLRELFQASLSGPAAWNAVIAEAGVDLSDRRLAVDVGAGDGRLLGALLDAYPDLQGIAFDRPGVAARAPLAHPRLTWQGGSFFDAVPAGDVHLLRWVLHDWPDEQAVAVLRRCREASAAGGLLLVLENLLDTPAGAGAALLDVSMMVFTGGRERTGAEYASLLERGGWRLERSIPTTAGLSVLTAGAA